MRQQLLRGAEAGADLQESVTRIFMVHTAARISDPTRTIIYGRGLDEPTSFNDTNQRTTPPSGSHRNPNKRALTSQEREETGSQLKNRAPQQGT